ncbi:MAG TPA: hypothetical protein VGI75_04265 [Pirellulales bacterium]
MSDLLQEYCDSRGVPLRVDRAGGVIRGVKVLGLTSRNGREYRPEALARAVSLYDGAKVNVNHSKGHPLSPRDYQERIGVIRNVQYRSGDGIFGDFHFNPKHYLSEQLVWDAEHAPENVGFSHNVQARTARRGEIALVEEILRVHSVDLVADPATTHGLFESTSAPVTELVIAPLSEEEDRSPTVNAAAVAAAEQASLRDAGSEASLPTSAIKDAKVASADKLIRERTADIDQLRREVDNLRAEKAVQERRALVALLLAEYQLPNLDSGDPRAKAIVSDAFVEWLLAAPDEQGIRRLIEERVRLLGFAEAWRGSLASYRRGPMSRDQSNLSPDQVRDAKSFAQSICY